MMLSGNHYHYSDNSHEKQLDFMGQKVKLVKNLSKSVIRLEISVEIG